MRLPVDTSVVHFVSAGPAEPSLDFDTKQQKTDANGVAINQVHLFVVRSLPWRDRWQFSAGHLGLVNHSLLQHNLSS